MTTPTTTITCQTSHDAHCRIVGARFGALPQDASLPYLLKLRDSLYGWLADIEARINAYPAEEIQEYYAVQSSKE